MFDQIRQIFVDLFMVDPGQVQPDTPREQIPKWDSLNHLLLVNEVEARFGVQLTTDQILGLKTPGDIEAVLAAHGVAA